MLRLSRSAYLGMIGHSFNCLPEEMCGLLGGTLGTDEGPCADAPIFYPCRNAAASAKVFTVDPKDHLKADYDSEDRNLELIGVVHSHTHTDAYPSPTDVAAAPDPGWHYVIVSLKYEEPVVRSYRIVDGTITEERVVVDGLDG